MKRPASSLVLPALAWIALGGCDFGSSRAPGADDPAIEFHLKAESGRYGEIGRWAHQFMLVDEAVSRLEARGFACEPAAPEASTRTCVKASWWRRSELVVLSFSEPLRRLVKAEGMRYRDGPGGRATSGLVAAPGLSFRSTRAFASFVLDSSTGFYRDCQRGTGPRGCLPYMTDQRRQHGWPAWDGSSPVAVGSAAAAIKGLQETGFACDEARGLSSAHPLPMKWSEGFAWLECGATTLDGQQLQVRLAMNPEGAALERIRAVAGTDSVDIPIVKGQPATQASQGGEMPMLVRDTGGRSFLIHIALNRNSRNFDLRKTLPALEETSRERLFRLAVRQAQEQLDRYGNGSPAPLLQRIEVAAALFARYGTDIVSMWRTARLEMGAAARASLAMADCPGFDVSVARACFAAHFADEPRLRSLLSEAIAEVLPFTKDLPPDHMVRQRLQFVASATTD